MPPPPLVTFSLPRCPISNVFEIATRTYRHLANGIESENETDGRTPLSCEREHSKLIIVIIIAIDFGKFIERSRRCLTFVLLYKVKIDRNEVLSLKW